MWRSHLACKQTTVWSEKGKKCEGLNGCGVNKAVGLVTYVGGRSLSSTGGNNSSGCRVLDDGSTSGYIADSVADSTHAGG